jgi:predicted amidophosphoribosyltransferase
MPEKKIITPTKNEVSKLSNGCCAGCNHALLPHWKFCAFCGLSTEQHDQCPVCKKLIRKRGLFNHIRLMTDKKHQAFALKMTATK